MRKYIFIFLSLGLLAVGANPLFAQHRADRQNLENEDSFSMIVLGDPQTYNKYDINQPIFELCTAWIADNVDHLNIKAVLCTGDLVEQNENIKMNRKMVNQTSREMWEAASRSLSRLDGKVPYIISCGNHDYGYKTA
ncbi:MAG TPA: serine/threonine protein phosphatase, partial [Rikenellaceae bacterium]|nr:serine/threonine protein phosphatase [Rikenellaceae bacterium]